MAPEIDTESVRSDSLKYLWMHNRDWTHMAEQGGPLVITQGKGVRVVDSEGKEWIDANGGYTSVNVGYGRTEIADAAYEQALKTVFAPVGTTTEPVVRLAAKLAPGSLNRSFMVSGGSEANETAPADPPPDSPSPATTEVMSPVGTWSTRWLMRPPTIPPNRSTSRRSYYLTTRCG